MPGLTSLSTPALFFSGLSTQHLGARATRPYSAYGNLSGNSALGTSARRTVALGESMMVL